MLVLCQYLSVLFPQQHKIYIRCMLYVMFIGLLVLIFLCAMLDKLFVCTTGKPRGSLLYLPDPVPAAVVAGRLLVLLAAHHADALLLRGSHGQPAPGGPADSARHEVRGEERGRGEEATTQIDKVEERRVNWSECMGEL